MYYHFKIHKEPDGYWAECIELEGCVTQGDSLDELQKNMEEALMWTSHILDFKDFLAQKARKSVLRY